MTVLELTSCLSGAPCLSLLRVWLHSAPRQVIHKDQATGKTRSAIRWLAR